MLYGSMKRTIRTPEQMPKSFEYAVQEAGEVQPVFFRAADHDVIAIVEPGHDASVMWHSLWAFLEQERLT